MSRQHLLESRQALSLALESSALARAMCSLAERCHCVEELRLVRIRERFSCAFRAKPSSFSHRAVLLSLARMFPRGRRVVPRRPDDDDRRRSFAEKCDFVVVISCPMSATFEVLTLCSLSRPLSFQLNGAQLSLRFRTENRAFKAIFAGKSGQL